MQMLQRRNKDRVVCQDVSWLCADKEELTDYSPPRSSSESLKYPESLGSTRTAESAADPPGRPSKELRGEPRVDLWAALRFEWCIETWRAVVTGRNPLLSSTLCRCIMDGGMYEFPLLREEAEPEGGESIVADERLAIELELIVEEATATERGGKPELESEVNGVTCEGFEGICGR
jgi:hypothetical protein